MKTKAIRAKNDDDQTTTNSAMVAGYPSATSTSTNESPPTPGPSQGHRAEWGALGPKNYSRGVAARDAYADRCRHFTPCVGESMAKQSFKDECDINLILARYQRTGILEHTRNSVAQYLDVSGADFQEAQNLIAGARSMFYELPAGLRERFENDPAKLLSFLEDEKNRPEAITLGLLRPEAGQATPLPTPPASVEPAASNANVGALAPTTNTAEGVKTPAPGKGAA